MARQLYITVNLLLFVPPPMLPCSSRLLHSVTLVIFLKCSGIVMLFLYRKLMLFFACKPSLLQVPSKLPTICD